MSHSWLPWLLAQVSHTQDDAVLAACIQTRESAPSSVLQGRPSHYRPGDWIAFRAGALRAAEKHCVTEYLDVVEHVALLEDFTEEKFRERLAAARNALPDHPEWMWDARVALVASELVVKTMRAIAGGAQ